MIIEYDLCGDSGWLYQWNEKRSLRWYVENSGLNAVELNSSFYRIPTERQVESWAEVGKTLRWAVKVHRSITHFSQLTDMGRVKRFLEVFSPLGPLVDFFLFQMPPRFVKNVRNMEKVGRAASLLGRRAAFEFRHPTWFSQDTVTWGGEIGVTLVSVDSPEARWVVKTGEGVYIRMHGRTFWYSHFYTEEELREVAAMASVLRPRRLYVFFNNNHAMLENARAMLNILKAIQP